MQTCEQGLTTALEIIEQGCREQPYCPACGQPNSPVAHGDVVWLECPSRSDGRTRLARIISLQAGHTRQFLVDGSATAPISQT